MDINKEYKDIEKILKNHKPKLVEKDFYDLLLNEDIGRFMDESPDKDISVTVKIPMDKLLGIKTAIEKENQGTINDMPLLATEIVNNLIWRYFNPESISPDDFIDLTVREDQPKNETVLSTANMPNTVDQPRTMKEEDINEKLANCKRCGGEAHIYNDGGPGYKNKGDWIAACKQCDNEYHGCDVKSWTTKHWNDANKMENEDKASLINASYYENGKYLEDIPLDIAELEGAEILTADEQLALNPREEDIGKTFYHVGKNIYAIKGEK